MVEKELEIRKRILKDFNKKEEDFEDPEEYNRYLEEVEDIIYNLCNNIEILETNKRIEQYKKDNRELIMRNKQRMGRDELELEMILEQEKEIVEIRENEFKNVEQESKKKKTAEREKLIDELMFSTDSAQSILQNFAYKEKIEAQKVEKKLIQPIKPKTSKFSSGINISSSISSQFLPIPVVEEGEPYEYLEPVVDTNGPPIPASNELKKFLKNVRVEAQVERAGGFQSHYSCLRALQESMQALYS
jgi:CDK-activating kinase assembly factor MAT1